MAGLFLFFLSAVTWGDDMALQVERARLEQKYEDFLAHKLSRSIRERVRTQAASEMGRARLKQEADREKNRIQFIRSGERRRAFVDAEKAEKMMTDIRRTREADWEKSAKSHSEKKESHFKSLKAQKKVSDLDEVGLGEDYFSDRETE